MKRSLFYGLLFGLIVWGGCASPEQRQASQSPHEQDIGKTLDSDLSGETSSQKSSAKGADQESIKNNTPSKLSQSERESLYMLVMQGSFLEAKERYEAAGEKYAKAYDAFPDSAYLGAMTGYSLLKSGKVGEAIQFAKKAIENSTAEIEAYRVLGEAYTIQKRWDKAIEQYETILTLDPDSMQTMRELVELYRKLNQFNKAIALYRRMMKLDSAREEFYRFTIAYLYNRLNRFDDALEEYKIIAAQTSRFPEVYVYMGGLYERQGRVDEAIEAYLSALNNVSEPERELRIRERLGRLYSIRSSWQEATHQYERIIKLEPDELEHRKTLANLYIKRGLYEKALEKVKTVAEKRPYNHQVQSLKKDILHALDRDEQAYTNYLDALAKAIEQESVSDIRLFIEDLSQTYALENLSSFKLLDRFETYLKQAEKRLGRSPDILFARANYLDFYLKNKEENQSNGDNHLVLKSLLKDKLNAISTMLEQAQNEGNLRLAKEIAKEYLAWYSVRKAMKEMGTSESFIHGLIASHEAETENISILHALASAYVEEKDWVKAESYYDELLDLSENNFNLYKDLLFQAAMVYEKLNRLADIERLMKKGMERYPQEAEFYNYLGYTYADRNVRLDEALSLIEKALRLNPNDGNIIDSLGWVYYRLGKNDAAIEHLEKASSLNKNHPVILDHLGDAYARVGKVQTAVSFWKKALKHGPEHPYEFTEEFQTRIKQKIREGEKNRSNHN